MVSCQLPMFYQNGRTGVALGSHWRRRMETRFNFTKPKLDALGSAEKRIAYHDGKTPGLILLVYPSGVKTFFLQKKLAGRAERIRLGNFPAMTIEQARTKAAQVHGAIAHNENPAAVRRSVKAEPTFGEVFDTFLKKKRNRAGKPLSTKTVESYQVTVKEHMSGLVNLKLSQITADRLRSLKISSDAQNNRVRAIISSVFNWVVSEGLADVANPAKAIKNRFIKSRERFLQPDELPKFFTALETSGLRDFFMMCLLTGARKSNVLSMRWKDINLEEAIWMIPKTKNGDSQRVPLTPEAIQILHERYRQAIINAVWVFPGAGKTGHLVEPKRAWTSILEKAGLDEHLRIHDLRRTLGSWQARAGASLTVIGKSLGHKSQQATAIYGRLDLDPVRQSVEQATSAMLAAGKPKSAIDTVTPCKKGERLS